MMYLGDAPIGIATNVKLVERGSYTPDADINVGSVHIPHSLGITPDFVIVDANITNLTSDIPVNTVLSGVRMKKTFISQQAPVNNIYFFSGVVCSGENKSLTQTWFDTTTSPYLTDTTFMIPSYNTGFILHQGITYNYIIGKLTN